MNNDGINSLTFVPPFFFNVCFSLFVCFALLMFLFFLFAVFFLISDTFILREICQENVNVDFLLVLNTNPSLNGGKPPLCSKVYT